MLQRVTLLLLFSISLLPCFAQKTDTASCGQKELMQHFYATHPEYKQLNEQVEKLLQEHNQHLRAGQLPSQRVNGVVTLPVVVHIIHNNGAENITDAQVFQGIQHLNEAFANTGYYDPADGVNTQIQFCMAQRDPSNNLTNGITRDISPYTVMGGTSYYSDDQHVKNINRWNPLCYINIWLVKSIPTSVVGYAYLPSAHGTNVDGIIEEAAYFGSSNANDVVIVHEMGHYLGLYHTFEGGCTNNDCTNDGDKVCDTPPDQSTAGISCTSTVNSCTTDMLSGFATDQNDLTQDYMDYGNFNCMKVFTQGQSDRMNWFIQNVRKSLLACKSCMVPCPAPVTADFTSPVPPITSGSSNFFTNTSVNAASYEWYVNGVLQSTATNFNYTFPAVGIYTVKLVAKSGNPLCDDAVKSITVNAVCGIMAGFTKSAAIASCGTNINFTNISTGATNYEWFVNSISQSTATNFLYTASTAGKYIIKLVAKNAAANCQQEYIDTVEYTCSVITDFTPAFNTILVNAPVTFNSTGSGASTYQWLVNGVPAGSGPTLSYTFNTIGSYSIQLITGNGTCSSYKYGVVYVTDVCGNAAYLFQKNYGAGLTSGSNDIQATTDGGSVLAERMVLTGNSNTDAAILKLDAGGNVQWMNAYSNNANSYFSKIKTTLDGGYIAIGANPSGTGTAKIFIVKTLSTGVVDWSREYTTGDGSGCNGTDIIQSVDGSYYFTGSTLSTGSINAGSDAIVGKCDGSGNIVWIKTYDARSSEVALGLADDNTQLIVCGNKSGQIAASGFLLSINKLDGSVAWAKSYLSIDENFNQVFTETNGYYVNATRRLTAGGNTTDHVYIKTDKSGNITYSKYIQPFGPTGGPAWASSFVKPNGNIISLSTSAFGGTYYDFLVQEINTAAGLLWTKKYNRPNNTWMSSITKSNDNGLLLGGFSLETISAPPIQTYVMKLDSAGNAGGCPSQLTSAELLSASYITSAADFTAKAFQPQVANNHIATLVNVTANTVCQYIKCDSVKPPIDTCMACTHLHIYGKDTVCNFRDTLIFYAKKDTACTLTMRWHFSSAYVNTFLDHDSTIQIQFKKTGTVYLYGELFTPCQTIKDSILITILPAPDSIHLGPDIQLCKLSSLTLHAGNGFTSYLWNDGSTDSTLTVYNPGQYFVAASDHCGNVYHDTINVSLAPDVPFDVGPDLKICDKDTITITAPGNFSKYIWSANYNINNTNGSTIKVWPSKDTSYTVVAEVANGCTVVDTIRITVNKSIPLNLGNDTSFCVGGFAVLKAPNGFSAYLWQDGSTNQTYTATQKGLYWVQATHSNGCISKDTAEIKQVYSLPAVSLGNDFEICLNEIHVLNAGAGFASYLWQDSSVNATYSTSRTGVYRVQVTDNNNCKNADTVIITGYKPIPQNFIDSSISICIGRNNELRAKGIWKSYLWNNNARGSSITIVTAGNYWLEVTNDEGCNARDTIKVIAKDCAKGIYFPNAFTPDNDGRNDTYKPVVNGKIEKIKFIIYNRLGEKVFETSDPFRGWDGVYKGKPQASNTFVWYCNYQFAGDIVKIEKGTVILVR